jgi:thioesterase domain-containing protein
MGERDSKRRTRRDRTLNTVPEFLEHLRAKNIFVRLDGDRLRCSAPPGALTTTLSEEIQVRKSDIVYFLRMGQSLAVRPRAVVPLQPHGTRPPIFGVGGPGDFGFCYRALSQALGTEQPFYGLEPPGLNDSSQALKEVADLADYFSAAIREVHPDGPLIIVGYCAGGTVAFELARRLLAQGGKVALLILLACPYPTAYRLAARLKQRLNLIGSPILRHAVHISSLPAARRLQYLRYVASRVRYQLGQPSRDRLARAKDPVAGRVKMVEDAMIDAVRQYKPRHFEGRMALILTNESYKDSSDRPLAWQHHGAAVEVFAGPPQCHHDAILTDFAPATARLIEKALVAASSI